MTRVHRRDLIVVRDLISPLPNSRHFHFRIVLKNLSWILMHCKLLFYEVMSWKMCWSYLCNQCLSPLTLWVWTLLMAIVYSVQHYVIKFVSDLRQVIGFFTGTAVSFTNKSDCHDITEILLKVVINTINPSLPLL